MTTMMMTRRCIERAQSEGRFGAERERKIERERDEEKAPRARSIRWLI